MKSLALVRFLPAEPKIGFIKMRLGALIFSALLILGSIASFAIQNLNFGIDFRGGTLVEMVVEDGQTVQIEEIREVVEGLGLGDAGVTTFGEEGRFLVRMELLTPEQAMALAEARGESIEEGSEEFGVERAQQLASAALQEGLEAADLGIATPFERIEFVGPGVSGELITTSILAVVIALALMLIYIWFRFEWQYSAGAIIALAHDVIATIGMFAVTQMEFNISTIAAILTIVGYSMNDTVVVYDRIRENFRKYKKMPLPDVLNMSINDTLSRTILTSLTTLVALGALYILGGPALQGFAAAMIWGVLIGTYSSIFVAAPLLLVLDVKRETVDS